MKKLFDCGHKGKGKFCNRCRQELRKQREIEMNREARINRYKVIGRNPGDMPPLRVKLMKFGNKY